MKYLWTIEAMNSIGSNQGMGAAALVAIAERLGRIAELMQAAQEQAATIREEELSRQRFLREIGKCRNPEHKEGSEP